jgi:uncharacterized protein
VKLVEHPFYKKVIKDAWSYWTGAILLAVLNISLFALAGKPWGITGVFANWGAWIYKFIGGQPENWAYYQSASNAKSLSQSFFNNGLSVQNIGIIFGALLATLLASQFKIKKIKSWKQVVAAVLGGLLMGYGARIAFGCNIGALFSGIASMSLHGWVYAIFIFFGAWIGSKVLVKYFMT